MRSCLVETISNGELLGELTCAKLVKKHIYRMELKNVLLSTQVFSIEHLLSGHLEGFHVKFTGYSLAVVDRWHTSYSTKHLLYILLHEITLISDGQFISTDSSTVMRLRDFHQEMLEFCN